MFFINKKFFTVIILVSLLLFYFFTSCFLFTEFFTLAYIFIFSYTIISIWYYFINIYKWGTFTTNTQRFWKRAFMLFWIVEGFLFFIFIVLFLVAPEEVFFSLDRNCQNVLSYSNQTGLYKQVVYYLVVLLLCWCLLLLKKQGKVLFLFIVPILLWFILFIFLEEVFHFFVYLASSKEATTTHFKPNDTCVKYSAYTATNYRTEPTTSFLTSTVYNYNRTSSFFVQILLFLRFWHVVFILGLFLLIIHKQTNDAYVTFDLLSIVQQSTAYLLYFFLLGFILNTKMFVYFFFKWSYFWFFENISYYSYILFFWIELLRDVYFYK